MTFLQVSKMLGRTMKEVGKRAVAQRNMQGYKLTPKLKVLLSKSPETLREPKVGEFDTQANYKKALGKYRKYGHWATPAPDEVEAFRKTQ